MAELRTERLLLRRWKASDKVPFATLNADPEMMRFFLRRPTREASDQLAELADADLERQGWDCGRSS